MTFLVVGQQPWNHGHFREIFGEERELWEFASDRLDLDSLVSHKSYRYIFFVHWSWKVHSSLLSRCPCICFHMTDVPYGRGGTPLQNLIERGHRETMLSALQMTDELDAGPVYLKRPLSLEGGTAEEIYMRASLLSCQMAREIVENDIQPKPQTGEVVKFKRRTPQQSILPAETPDLQKIFDHIRMLDADGYPRAFIEIGALRIEFSRAALYHDGILADAKISLVQESEKESIGDE